MNNQVANWEVEGDPYNNYQGVREEMMRGKTQANPYAYPPQNIQTSSYNAAQDLVDEIYDEADEIVEEVSVLNEAMARIEQANLYQTLLSHDLLAPGSARPEILDKVQAELKNFVQNRLEVLLGMKRDDQPLAKAKPEFDAEEVTALKALASKVLKREPVAAVSAPTVRPLEATVATPAVKPLNVAPVQPIKNVKAQPAPQKTVAKKKQPKPTANDIKNAQELTPELAAQLVSQRPRKAAAAGKPIPMPSAEQMNQKITMETQASALNNKMGGSVGGGDGGVLLKAIQASLR